MSMCCRCCSFTSRDEWQRWYHQQIQKRTEHDERSTFALKVLLVLLVLFIAGQTGVLDPLDLVVFGQVLGNLECVLAMTFHPKGQRFDSLNEHPGVVWADAATEVTERHCPHPKDVPNGEERFWQVHPPAQSAVAGIGLGEHRVLPGVPFEPSRIGDDPTDARTVAARPFGKGMANDVGAPLYFQQQEHQKHQKVEATKKKKQKRRKRIKNEQCCENSFHFQSN